jgi:hypothetical protein
MEHVANKRHAEIDDKCRKAESMAADADDIGELEVMRRRSKKGRKNAS